MTMSPDQRNIVVLGASISGLGTTHFTLKQLLPSLRIRHPNTKYHVYLLNPSPHWFFRPAAPRTNASSSLLAPEKLLFDIEAHFRAYGAEEFTFVQARASGLDTEGRVVRFVRMQEGEGGEGKEEELPYHALVLATGSRTTSPSLSANSTTSDLLAAIAKMNVAVATASSIVVSGGGPSSVETAAEMAEYRNGAPGLFGAKKKKVDVKLVTSGPRLLGDLREDVARAAEKKLKDLGVDIVYNARVDGTDDVGGKTHITLSTGEKIETDLYIPVHGVRPNTSYLPPSLLDANAYVAANPKTLRVDAAGPRIYALGDVASYSRNNAVDILESQPVLHANMMRDLLAFDEKDPGARPKGNDRELALGEGTVTVVPIGSRGGVGQIKGWSVPSWAVWFKARDYMLGISGEATAGGGRVGRVKLTAEESV